MALFPLACSRPAPEESPDVSARQDLHSHANAAEVRVRHLALDLSVSFDRKSLDGFVTLELERVSGHPSELILDSRNLAIRRAEASAGGVEFSETTFALGPADPILGSPLSVSITPQTTHVRIHYATSPAASGLQWLEPAQTAGKKHPFLYTQSQAIHARSWIPLQDTPGVRATYRATIRTPKDLLAVMSAEMGAPTDRSGSYDFEMPQPIPSYLIALAVGDLAFQPMSDRTGVYAEPSVVARAASEFEDTEQMMQAVEELYGPYRWGRYDILVLPPSFPFGGMENPRLTFATPTVLAGDKSLVALVAHELAHSWSGNLVTNATWRDFWLNEGFTVYLEDRIQELVFGQRRAAMEATLEVQELRKELEKLEPRDQILYIDLAGRDPDDAITSVPYIKGMLFLRTLEKAVGRETFDAFLRGYFDHFAFQSITTADFLSYLRENLLAAHPQVSERVPIDRWIYDPGIPEGAAIPTSDALEKVSAEARRWLTGEVPAGKMATQAWSTQEWLHFLRALPEKLDPARLRELDQAFALTRSGNSEIVDQWLLMAIRNEYQPAYPRLEEFLTTVGRRKFLKPLYEELVKTPEGKRRALEIYKKARPLYHPISQSTIDGILGIGKG